MTLYSIGTQPTCESEIYWSVAINSAFVHVPGCMFNVSVTCMHTCVNAVCIIRCILILLVIYLSVGISFHIPDTPSNGGVDNSAGTYFGHVARYSCDAGYTLNGAAERTCQDDGEWNGTEPTCESEILESSNQMCLCVCHCVHI